MKKTIILVGMAIVLGILLVGTVDAVFWACFTKGEQINFCNPATPDRTCSSSMGCSYCMSTYDPSNDCYVQGNINVCNAQASECSLVGNHTLDNKAPTLTVREPDDGGVYMTKSLLLDVVASEIVDMYYLDENNVRGQWVSVCNDCSLYSKKRTFSEGLNKLVFRARDGNGNFGFYNVSFMIDTKKPRIVKTWPKPGFASGTFGIEFTEDNVKKLVLHYGVFGVMKNHTVSKENECTYLSTKRWVCESDVSLSQFNGQQISYWYVLEDVAGSVAQSKPTSVKVDLTAPLIDELIVVQKGKQVDLILSVSESNFARAEYMDQSAFRPKWVVLCTSLKLGKCTKRLTLSTGMHELDIQVSDKAGNMVGVHKTITI